MYADFFGFRELPFNNTPDPRFFYSTPDHEEALASLIYAVKERKGFVLLTGDIGAGKTLVTRLMLRHFKSNIAFANINHAVETPADLMEAICTEFELPFEPESSPTQLVRVLHDFLLAQFGQNIPVVLVLDEAQNLAVRGFEQLRMIGNLEADDAKLLQIAIVGQPELQQLFQSPLLRQLRQRIFRSFHLPALTPEHTKQYIRHRLSVVSDDSDEIFAPDAIDVIYRTSHGLPRIINTVCDNALLSAYSADRRRIDGPFVSSAVSQLMVIGGVPPPPPVPTRSRRPVQPTVAYAHASRSTRDRLSQVASVRPIHSPVQRSLGAQPPRSAAQRPDATGRPNVVLPARRRDKGTMGHGHLIRPTGDATTARSGNPRQPEKATQSAPWTDIRDAPAMPAAFHDEIHRVRAVLNELHWRMAALEQHSDSAPDTPEKGGAHPTVAEPLVQEMRSLIAQAERENRALQQRDQKLRALADNVQIITLGLRDVFSKARATAETCKSAARDAKIERDRLAAQMEQSRKLSDRLLKLPSFGGTARPAHVAGKMLGQSAQTRDTTILSESMRTAGESTASNTLLTLRRAADSLAALRRFSAKTSTVSDVGSVRAARDSAGTRGAAECSTRSTVLDASSSGDDQM